MLVQATELMHEYFRLIKGNNHEALRKLFKTSPVDGYDYSTSVCRCGCPERNSIIGMVLNDIQVHNISVDTIRLLFELGIIKATDMDFFEKLICRVYCYEDCVRVYALINADVFDPKTVASYIKTYIDAGIDPETGTLPSGNALSFIVWSFALRVPIWCRGELIQLANKFTTMGVKLDDMSKKDKDRLLKYIDYDPETNTFSQSTGKFVTELTVYLKDRTLSDDDAMHLNETVKRFRLCYVPETKTVVGFIPL
jgi:hypothetical protein